MIDEATFRRESDTALESLKQSLIRAEEEGGFEAEEKNGVLERPLRGRRGEVRLHPQHAGAPGLDLRALHLLQTGVERSRARLHAAQNRRRPARAHRAPAPRATGRRHHLVAEVAGRHASALRRHRHLQRGAEYRPHAHQRPWADEIIVVDSTPPIAPSRSRAARRPGHRRAWPGFAAQKNSAIASAPATGSSRSTPMKSSPPSCSRDAHRCSPPAPPSTPTTSSRRNLLLRPLDASRRLLPGPQAAPLPPRRPPALQ